MKSVIPPWMVKVAITTLIGLLLSGAGAWGVHLSTKSNDHEKRISVVEEHQVVHDKVVDERLYELKQGQDEQNRDTKEILKMLRRR